MRAQLSLFSLLFSSACFANYQTPVINISGFGSIAALQASNAAGYMGSSDDLDFKIKSSFGLQLSAAINPQTQAHFQLISKGNRDFKPYLDIAYLEHQFEAVPTKIYLGSFRAPFFAYSEFLDVGYAYPIFNPNDALYDYVSITSITGISLIHEYKIDNDLLTLQPFYGTGKIHAEDSYLGEVETDDLFGITVSYHLSNSKLYLTWTKSGTEDSHYEFLANKSAKLLAAGYQHQHQHHHFELEVADYQHEGGYADIQIISTSYGYQFDQLTPYVSFSSFKSTDDEIRESLLPNLSTLHSHQRYTYSLGLRYDFIENLALKTDLTYVDFRGTSGANLPNVDLDTGKILFDNSTIFSLSLDFIF